MTLQLWVYIWYAFILSSFFVSGRTSLPFFSPFCFAYNPNHCQDDPAFVHHTPAPLYLCPSLADVAISVRRPLLSSVTTLPMPKPC